MIWLKYFVFTAFAILVNFFFPISKAEYYFKNIVLGVFSFLNEHLNKQFDMICVLTVNVTYLPTTKKRLNKKKKIYALNLTDTHTENY